MGYRFSHFALGAIALAPFAGWATDGQAQNYTVVSVSPSTGSAGTFTIGAPVVTLTMSPTGSFTPTGYQRSATAPTYTVTLKCVSHAGHNCATSNTFYLVMNDLSASNTGRLGPLQNFTMGSNSFTAGTVTSAGTPPATTIPLSGMTNGQTTSFQIGFDAPLQSSGATGSTVTRTFSVGTGVATGSITSTMNAKMTAITWNPMAMARTGALDFGKVVKPASGTGTFTLSPGGSLAASGGGVIMPGNAHSVPTFTVTGEGAQAFSLTVPSSFLISGSGNTLTVATTTSFSGTTQTLSSVVSSQGSFAFTVGGVLPVSSTVPSGAYTGSLIVGAQYN